LGGLAQATIHVVAVARAQGLGGVCERQGVVVGIAEEVFSALLALMRTNKRLTRRLSGATGPLAALSWPLDDLLLHAGWQCILHLPQRLHQIVCVAVALRDLILDLP
jgi:hypothetical protein